jgi:hypothetical protein
LDIKLRETTIIIKNHERIKLYRETLSGNRTPDDGENAMNE